MSSRVIRWDPDDGPADDVARRLRSDHPGERIDVRDPGLADALAEQGATAIRRSLLMSATPPGPSAVWDVPGIDIVRMVDDPARYAGSLLRAFPPDHPDFDPAISDLASAEAALRSYFDGMVIGPWLAEASVEVRDADGAAVGAIVIGRMPPNDDDRGGPWITDVFVEPAHQGGGLGRALLVHSLERLAAMGEPVLSLAVQIDNPARRLYERVGFTTGSSWTRFQL